MPSRSENFHKLSNKRKRIVHTLIFSRSQATRNNIGSSLADLFERFATTYFNIFQYNFHKTWENSEKSSKNQTQCCALGKTYGFATFRFSSRESSCCCLILVCVHFFFFCSYWHNKSRNKRASRNTSIRLFPAGFHGCCFVLLLTAKFFHIRHKFSFCMKRMELFFCKTLKNRKIEKKSRKIGK